MAVALFVKDSPYRRDQVVQVKLRALALSVRTLWGNPGTRLGMWSHFTSQFAATVFTLLWGYPFLVQGLGTTFAAMLVAQVIWGIGYTFTSGADQAWLADEIGAGELARVLIRAQQYRLGATVAGILAAGALGLLDIQVPLVVSGSGFLVLALVLAAVMRETGFAPVPRERRASFRRALASLAASDMIRPR